MRVRVLEEHGGQTPLGAGPADDLVVIVLGQLGRERGQLGVLVDLALPAVGHRRGEPRARDDGDRAVQRTRQPLGLAVLGGLRPPLRGERVGERGRALDVAAQRRGGAARGGGLQRGDERVADRDARLEAARQRHHRDAVGARALGERAAGGRDDARGAGGPGRVVRGERLVRGAGVARAQHQRLRPRPGRDVVVHDEAERAAQVGRQDARGQPAADRGAAHPGDEQPAGRVDRGDRGRVEPPQRVAQVQAEIERLGQLPRAVDRGAGGRVECGHQNSRPPSGIVTPGKTRAPLVTTLPAPIVTPSPSTASPSTCV